MIWRPAAAWWSSMGLLPQSSFRPLEQKFWTASIFSKFLSLTVVFQQLAERCRQGGRVEESQWNHSWEDRSACKDFFMIYISSYTQHHPLLWIRGYLLEQALRPRRCQPSWELAWKRKSDVWDLNWTGSDLKRKHEMKVKVFIVLLSLHVFRHKCISHKPKLAGIKSSFISPSYIESHNRLLIILSLTDEENVSPMAMQWPTSRPSSRFLSRI